MSDTELVVPRNLDAEKAVIGAVIQSEAAFTQARRLVTEADFYNPASELIWNACEQLDRAGNIPTPREMAILDYMTRADTLKRAGGAPYLATLMETSWTAVNVEYWARKVHQAYQARRILQVQQRMGQVIGENQHDLDALLGGMARENLNLELLIDERAADEPLDGLMSWPDLWNIYPSETIEWLIPELLVAEDVFMLLATEGGGKSWVSRQFCLCLAAGVHPFRAHQRIPPVRSLLVDLENAPAMVAWESRRLGHQVSAVGEINHELAQVWIKEDGINLRNPAHAMLLERAIAETQPKLVALGSLYKAFERGRDDWDTAAEETRIVLDRLRRRYGFALLLEHHMPKATGGSSDRPQSPYGSSVWQKWPSIGKILNRVGDNMYELANFRGTRMGTMREIPVALERGGVLPWSPVWNEDDMIFGMWDHLKPKQGQHRH